MASKVVERVDNHSNWEETCLVTTIFVCTDGFGFERRGPASIRVDVQQVSGSVSKRLFGIGFFMIPDRTVQKST